MLIKIKSKMFWKRAFYVAFPSYFWIRFDTKEWPLSPLSNGYHIIDDKSFPLKYTENLPYYHILKIKVDERMKIEDEAEESYANDANYLYKN